MIAYVAVGHLRGGVVGEDTEPVLYSRDVVGRIIDQEVDILREAAGAVGDDGEATDQHVFRAGLVQGAADTDDVFRLRCSSVRSVIWVIHASASSKLEKR